MKKMGPILKTKLSHFHDGPEVGFTDFKAKTVYNRTLQRTGK